MKDNRLKEQVMKDIREALMDKNIIADSETHITEDNPYNNEDLSVLFAQNFTRRGGVMYYCYNEGDIKIRIEDIQRKHGNVIIGNAAENLTGFLGHLGIDNCATCEANTRYPLGATLCETLIAEQGSILISSNQGLGLTMPTLTDALIVLAFTSQVVANWEAATERLRNFYTEFPEQIMVTNPGSLAQRKNGFKIYLILIEDED